MERIDRKLENVRKMLVALDKAIKKLNMKGNSMILSLLPQMNCLTVVVSAIVFFVIGSIWFSGIFRNAWIEELKDHNIVIKEPTSNQIATKMALTFGANLVASLAIALLVVATNSTTFASGFHLGVVCALGFALTAVASVFIWENRSMRLFLIDVGYPIVGIIVSAIILSLWR